MQLCDELLDRAKRDAGQPIPVVVNLASWAHHRPALGDWLVDELASGYQVPRGIATQWIEEDVLALLLDGLDEVTEAHRAACAEAVNAWRLDHGLVPVVVCSRTSELQALDERLRLEEAVELQPPSDAEVDRYLGFLEGTGTPIADVRAALTTDEELRPLLHSPLLLHVVALAYHGRPAPALSVPGTLRQRQAWLWEAYITRMMEQRPLDPRCGYTEEQALDWLARLARALRDRSQTEFHLDRLAPDWLPTPAHQLRARVATGLVGGVVSGLVFGPAFGLVAQAFGLTFTVPTAVMVGLVAGLIFGLIGGLVFGLAGRLTTSFEQSYPLRGFWSALRARLGRPLTQGRHKQQTGLNGAMQEPPYIAPVATVFGLVGGLAAGLSSGLFFGLTLGLLAALAAGLGCGLTVALVLGLSGELLFEQSEQLRWSWSNLRTGLSRALFGGLAGGLVFGLLFALVFGASAGLAFGLVFGLTVALAGGLSAGLGFGLVFALTVAMVFGGAACLQHYVVRAWLVRDKIAPWQYGPFLEAMAQRLLLRRSGSAYLFTHRLLRDYLADPNPVRIQAAA